MSDRFSPEDSELVPEKKKSQQSLLLLLLLLILLFVYLYFFTGLIKPRPEEAPPKPVAEAPAVKQKLPPRTGAPEAAKAPEAGQPAPAAPAAPVPPVQAKPAPAPAAQAKPAPAAQAKPAPAAQAKPAPVPPAQAKPAPAAPKAAPVPAAQAKKPEAPKKAEPVKKAEAKKPEPAKKPEVKKAEAAKPAQKPGAAKEAKEAKAAKPKAVAKAAPAFALDIEGDLAPSEAATVTAKLKQAGIGNVSKTSVQKSEAMHRLYLADFADHDEAKEELDRLKQVAPGAFMLKENGRYAVYAGSYLREGKAAVEQDRLFNKGVKLLLKSANIKVPVYRMRAGSFKDKAAADKAAAKLKGAGVTAKAVKVGK
ncbi:hypothetical protein GMSM_38190 [Geomonas sp. Red276]